MWKHLTWLYISLNLLTVNLSLKSDWLSVVPGSTKILKSCEITMLFILTDALILMHLPKYSIITFYNGNWLPL